jgi:F0F1-type ATP synthase assembly protein I
MGHEDWKDRLRPAEPRTEAPRPSAATSRFEALRAAGSVGTVGLSFVLAVAIGGWVGWWLDSVTGWSPVLFIVFLLLGLVAGVRNVYVVTKRYMK